MHAIRVALFAPGSKERVMTKALESGTDAVILDLEDSVPLAGKAEARTLVAGVIDSAAAHPRPLVTVRTNDATTDYLDGDLEAIVRPGLAAVILPKAETVADVQRTTAAIDRHEKTHGMEAGSVALILMIESALGVHSCFDLIKASPRVAATCFGSARDGDLQTDLGCAWSIEGTELLYARSKVLLDTRAAGAMPLDGVFSDLSDEDGLAADTRLSARLGYVGRTAIHPKQMAAIRAAYAVPADEVAYYEKVVREFEAVEKAGTAAITVDGKLIDYAMFARAKRVLELAKLDRPG